MPTRNVVLTEHLDEVIDQLVETGRYQNASEVLRDGLRMVEQREAREKAKLAALKEAAAIGFRDIEEGRFRMSARAVWRNSCMAWGSGRANA